MQDIIELKLPVGHFSWHISKGGCSGGFHLSRLSLSNCRTCFCALSLTLFSCFLGHFGATQPDARSLLPCYQASSVAAARSNTSRQPVLKFNFWTEQAWPPGNSGGKTPRKKRGKGHCLSVIASQSSVHPGSEIFHQMNDCVGRTQTATPDVPMVRFYTVASIQIYLLNPLTLCMKMTRSWNFVI